MSGLISLLGSECPAQSEQAARRRLLPVNAAVPSPDDVLEAAMGDVSYCR